MGSIYANSAIIAAYYLIPQTTRIRFRTAGISLPLHHPAEVVEWWTMNDILSSARVDLGFGSGWNQADFILSPDAYHQRKKICTKCILIIQIIMAGRTCGFLLELMAKTPLFKSFRLRCKTSALGAGIEKQTADSNSLIAFRQSLRGLIPQLS